jgi:hypothetical protein
MKSFIKTEINLRSLLKSWPDIFCIAACFIDGRIIQCFIFKIQSVSISAIVGTALTGIVAAAVVLLLGKFLCEQGSLKRVLLSGAVFFGVDLLLFNFFMPIVFSADIPDLILRTVIDAGSVTAGSLLLPVPLRPYKSREIRWIVR